MGDARAEVHFVTWRQESPVRAAQVGWQQATSFRQTLFEEWLHGQVHTFAARLFWVLEKMGVAWSRCTVESEGRGEADRPTWLTLRVILVADNLGEDRFASALHFAWRKTAGLCQVEGAKVEGILTFPEAADRGAGPDAALPALPVPEKETA